MLSSRSSGPHSSIDCIAPTNSPDYRPHPAVNKESVALCGPSRVLFIHVTGSKNTRTSYLMARLKDDEEKGMKDKTANGRGRASERRGRGERATARMRGIISRDNELFDSLPRSKRKIN